MSAKNHAFPAGDVQQVFLSFFTSNIGKCTAFIMKTEDGAGHTFDSDAFVASRTRDMRVGAPPSGCTRQCCFSHRVCVCVCVYVQGCSKSLVRTQAFNHFVSRLVEDTDDAGPEVRAWRLLTLLTVPHACRCVAQLEYYTALVDPSSAGPTFSSEGSTYVGRRCVFVGTDADEGLALVCQENHCGTATATNQGVALGRP